MSFNIGHVQGGTNAGWKKLKELPKWTCSCGNAQNKYAAECCGDRRP